MHVVDTHIDRQIKIEYFYREDRGWRNGLVDKNTSCARVRK